MKLDAARFDRAMNINREKRATHSAWGMLLGLGFSAAVWLIAAAAVWLL